MVGDPDPGSQLAWLAIVAGLVFAATVAVEAGQRRTEELARGSIGGDGSRDLARDVQLQRLLRSQTVQGMLLAIVASALATYSMGMMLLLMCSRFSWANECTTTSPWLALASLSAGGIWVWLVTEIVRNWTAYQASTTPLSDVVKAHDAAIARRVRRARRRSVRSGLLWLAGIFLTFLVAGLPVTAFADPVQVEIAVAWTVLTATDLLVVIIAAVGALRLWGSGIVWMTDLLAVTVVGAHVWEWANITWKSLDLQGPGGLFAVSFGVLLLTAVWGVYLTGLRGRWIARDLAVLTAPGLPGTSRTGRADREPGHDDVRDEYAAID
jgi:hypothetical protein